MSENSRHESFSPTRREFLAAGTAAAIGITGAGVALGDAVLDRDAAAAETSAEKEFTPIAIPNWIRDVTRMSFLGPDQVADAARIGVQVVHGNAVWPYYPLRRDGGKLTEAEHAVLKRFVDETHKHGMKLSLGLPPFPSVAAMKAHPEWRIAADMTDGAFEDRAGREQLGDAARL